MSGLLENNVSFFICELLINCTHLVLLALDERLQVGIGVVVRRPALALAALPVALDALLLAACGNGSTGLSGIDRQKIEG